MRTPANDPTGSKNTGEHIAWNSHVGLQAGRIEIDIAVFMDAGDHRIFHGNRNVIELGIAIFDSQSTREILQVNGAGIFDLIDRMPEAHKLSFFGPDCLDPGDDVFYFADLHQGFQYFCISTTMQRTFECPNGTGH